MPLTAIYANIDPIEAARRFLAAVKSGRHIVSKHRSAIIVFIAVTALALLGFFVAYSNHITRIEAGAESSAFAAWVVLLAGLIIAAALAAYLMKITQRALIEERLRNDRLDLEMQLAAARRIETMALLVGSIAHDFNNNLMAITGYAGLALAKAEDDKDSEMQDYLNMVGLGADKGTTLIRKLLSFSRGKSHRRGQSVELLTGVQDNINLLRRLLPEHIALRIEIAENVSVIRMDPLTLEQIIANLVINAKEAMSSSGIIQVELAQVTVKDRRCNACEKTFAGEWVRLTVSDNGKGLTLDNMDDVFQPFYTTKPEGKGCGLGMALVQNLVHGVGGHIELMSTAGKGTTVAVFFPLPAATNGEA